MIMFRQIKNGAKGIIIYKFKRTIRKLKVYEKLQLKVAVKSRNDT
jgi:hypothetical protein